MKSIILGRSRISKNWLFTPPLHGTGAAAVSVAAVAVATLIHLSLFSPMESQACTVFCPFILLISILCGWRWALTAAAGSAIICNTVLMGAPYAFHLQGPEIEVLVSFLGFSALMILVVQLFRLTAARSLRQAGAQERASGIVFSLVDGQVWASWYGIDAPVRLGSQDEVAPMMEDFIAQAELGKQLQADLAAPRRATG